ncbi:long-chain fatty acid--CoA ligase [Baekduia soli]|uniref:Acyl-CoA synthetase n=1 Tax=Baekduia soli TaxID=496014 RepID=A0A5B8U831_9ACTN|nr:AMP-dependent synthetase/ligase [Baekduia soli]QEC49111.1 long-chain fatty acid--CoA ligase [Baekduia soli]
MESSTAARRAVDASTIAQAFRITAAQRADQAAVRTKGGEVSWTWGELRERVDALAGGLAGLGLGKGDTIALMLGNRPEFHLADLAAIMVGATPFSIYMTYAPNQIEYVVGDAGARILITEQQFLANVLEARRSLPDLEHVIVVDGDAPEGTLALADVRGEHFDVEASVAAIGPEDVLTLIYTSGTTGPPKGVELAHRNLLAAVAGIEDIVAFPDASRVISWLPNAHIAERAAHHYLPIVFGFTVTCCPNPREIIAFLPEVRPHWFFAVPRIWEKLKSGLEAMIAGQEPEQQAASRAAIAAGLDKVRLEQAGEPVPAELAERVAAADTAMFAGLRSMLGLDEAVAINVGAAPTPVEVLEFFHAIGLPLGELWGMSETCGGGAVNPPERIKIGTVGPAIPGVELRLASDGELLVRSDIVMRGYRGLPDRTAEAIDADGWLHTGDIAEIDDEGYVKIVDRKKELIINAAGKNMSPANIEATIKTASPLIGTVVCIGDARAYNTALIVLDADFAPVWAQQHGIQDATLESLAHDDGLRAAIQEAIDAANAKLARVEQIKKFVIVEGDWLPGGDELTPTMKLKRKPIAEKYAAAISGMYVG